MYQDRYDNCLNEVAEICEPMKETLAKCLDLENNYKIDKYTIYKEMVEMELFNYFCELMEEENEKSVRNFKQVSSWHY